MRETIYYYFDTSIWIDIYNKRGHNGEVAKQLMNQLILKDFIVIYSNMVLIELKKIGFSEYEINQILNMAKPNHIKRVNFTKQQVEEAKRLAKQRSVPFGDALHAVIARDNCALLVSRDRDFDKLKDVIMAKKPEELI
jgi:predicted nucleic acid-binding protein